jgi:hypothetical protein
MLPSSDLLQRYQWLLADRMTTVRGIAEALHTGAFGPLTPTQSAAAAMLESSATGLWEDLEEIRHALTARPDLEDVATLVDAALVPLHRELSSHDTLIEIGRTVRTLRVRTGGTVAVQALRAGVTRVLAGLGSGGLVRLSATLAGDRLILELTGRRAAGAPAQDTSLTLEPKLGPAQPLLASMGGSVSFEYRPCGIFVRLTLSVAHH